MKNGKSRLNSELKPHHKFVITGIIGVYGTKRSYANSGRASTPLIGTYIGFSIVSALFAAVIIIVYAMGVANRITGSTVCRHDDSVTKERIRDLYSHGPLLIKKSEEKKCDTSAALGSLIIIFAILEVFVGIWASFRGCSNFCCDCCDPPVQSQQPAQQGQVIYLQTKHGPQAYIMTQGANGVNVAVPAMVPGQDQMSDLPAPQTNMSPAGGKSTDMPPPYQP